MTVISNIPILPATHAAYTTSVDFTCYSDFIFLNLKYERVTSHFTISLEGCLDGSVVQCLPLAQGVILGSRNQVLHRAPYQEPASPSA